MAFQISKPKDSNHSTLLMSLAGINKADLFYCVKLKDLHSSLLDDQNMATGIITMKYSFLNTICPK